MAKELNPALWLCLLVAMVVVAAASRTQASPITDGLLDPLEGYSNVHWVDINVELDKHSSTTISGGELWTYLATDTGNVYAAFMAPLNLVDNTYGDNTIGTYRGKKDNSHKFSDLSHSDKIQFAFTNGLGDEVLQVEMGYLFDDHGEYGLRDPVTQSPGTEAYVLNIGTSLNYNFNTLGYELTENSPVTDDNYTPDPDYPDWIFAVIYEIEVDGDVFGDQGFGEITIPELHVSPNKVGDNKMDTHITPEPASIALLLLGGVGALLARRKRIAKQA